MFAEPVLLRSKIQPPRPHRQLLARPAIAARLRAAFEYRLTVLQAGTGYGKTTALAALNDGAFPLFWYSADAEDADPQRFLAYLVAAFRTRLPELRDSLPVAPRDHGGAVARESWTNALDALLNALHESLQTPSLLVIDDVHFVAASAEVQALIDRLVTFLPEQLRVILASRYPLQLPTLPRWRVTGEVLELGREALAFQPDEIAALFRDTYGWACSADEIAALADKTEGWPIALQLVWQGIRSGTARSVADLLAQGPKSLAALFDYLATDVLGKLPPPLAAFLRDTAVLRELTPEACRAVTGREDSAELLAQLDDLNLLVVALGDGQYRYHHLFHDFLRAQAAGDPERLRAYHRRAARFFDAAGNAAEAAYHWLAAGDHESAAEAIAQAARPALRAGQLDTVLSWIDALPPPIVAGRPELQACLADVYRLRNRFDQALAWYRHAEQIWRARDNLAGVSRALRGQALVYLDQVRPAQAEQYLEAALHISDGIADRQSRARLLAMLAENKLNLGKPEEAEQLRAAARELREEGPGEDLLSVRVKLRTGQLDTAQQLLEQWINPAPESSGPSLPPRARREAVLILALIHAFRGQAPAAIARAEQGLALSEQLDSPFGTAVAHMRLGHARQLLPHTATAEQRMAARAAALRAYESAIALGDQIEVRRVRAEAMWGLARAHGFWGDLERARRAAAEGTDICAWAGDQWLAALIDLTLAASLVLAGEAAAALDPLGAVLIAFRECGDPFGQAAAWLWLSLAYHDLGRRESLTASLDELLALCESRHYDFLFTEPTLLGPPDPRRLTPLLLLARERTPHGAYVGRLLAALGLPALQAHPGYQLRVQTLGTFRVSRGAVVVEPRDWQRDKARQLFQLLLTNRGAWLSRDAIVETLWPQLAPEAAVRDFKVALNALNRALEPQRSPDAPFAFVARDGTAYRLRPEADLWLDAVAFEQACESSLSRLDRGDAAAIDDLEAAIALYGGDYLPDALYEDWASNERERLRTLFLRAATRLGQAWLDRGRLDRAMSVCERILDHDPCWEPAYRVLIHAALRQGNRPLAQRIYRRCVATLDEHLGVEPSPETQRLAGRIAGAGIVPSL